MPCSLATILFILMRCGMERIDALHRLPAACGNQLLACYWMEQGREIESISESSARSTKAQQEFEKMANRKHNFNFD